MMDNADGMDPVDKVDSVNGTLIGFPTTLRRVGEGLGGPEPNYALGDPNQRSFGALCCNCSTRPGSTTRP